MNDFAELEDELKKLRPLQPSAGLSERLEQALSEPFAEEKIIRPEKFRLNWVSIGFGLAAAAVFLLFARVSMERKQEQGEKTAQVSPVPKNKPALRGVAGSASSNRFIPADATQVVYNKRDEGLHFSGGSEQPLRRLRYQTHQTLRWNNPATGASLRVSYPSEEVLLIPISGQ